jgi:hypothetical protein
VSTLWIDSTNDTFAGAWALDPAGGTVHGNNTGATLETGEVSQYSYTRTTVWFLYTAIATDPVTFDSLDTTYDTILAVYHVTGGAPDVTGTDLTAVGFNDDDPPYSQSSFTFTPDAIGDQYYIQLGSFLTQYGDYVLHYPAGGGSGPGPTVPPPPPPISNAPTFTDTGTLREFHARLSPADGVDEAPYLPHETFYASDDFTIYRPPPPPPSVVDLDPVESASAIDDMAPPGAVVLAPIDGASAIGVLVLAGPVSVLLDELDGASAVTVAQRFVGHVALEVLEDASSVSVSVSLPDSGVGSLTGLGEVAVTENPPIRLGLFLTARADVDITPEIEDDPW